MFSEYLMCLNGFEVHVLLKEIRIFACRFVCIHLFIIICSNDSNKFPCYHNIPTVLFSSVFLRF